MYELRLVLDELDTAIVFIVDPGEPVEYQGPRPKALLALIRGEVPWRFPSG